MAPTWRALLTLGTLLGASSMTYAEDYLRSTSFDYCESSNQFNATIFDVTITPDNRTIAFDLGGEITFSGNASLDFSIIIHGNETQLFRQDPCSSGDASLCPTSPGQIQLASNIEFPERASGMIPQDVYTTSDLDAQFKLSFNNTATGRPWGCIEANLTNGASEASGTNSTSSGNNTSTIGSNTTTEGTNSTNGTSQQGSDSAAVRFSTVSSVVIVVPAIMALTFWL